MKAGGSQRGRDTIVPEPASQDGGRGALRAQGIRTRNAIIEAARTLLLECGSLEFTLREIAQRAGICISNLQYYFPTRLAVLRAVFASMIEACIRDLRHVVAQGAAPRDTLSLLVAKVLRNARDTETSALWCHFLSVVAIDPACAQLLDEWYGTLRNEAARLVAAANPALTRSERTAAASLLIAMVEGASTRIGVGLRNRAATWAMDECLLAAAGALLNLDSAASTRVQSAPARRRSNS